jgi:hypothetical protein
LFEVGKFAKKPYFSQFCRRSKRAAPLEKLLALLAIAFCWAHQVGEWLAKQRPLKIKKHGYKAQSTFRYGLDHLRRILTNFDHFDPIAWQQVIKLLSCT